MKVGEAMLSLLERAGIDTTDIKYKEIAALSSEVPEEFATQIEGMLTPAEAEKWAKNDPQVKKHYFSQAYNGIDANINDAIEDLGLSEEEAQAIRNEKSTGKKQILLLAAAKKVAATPSKKGSDEYEAAKLQIGELNKSVLKYKEELEIKLREKDQYHKDYVLNSKAQSFFDSQKWSENYPPSVRGDLAKIAFDKKLEKLGAIKVLGEDGEIHLMQKNNPDQLFYLNNKNVTFTEIAAEIMAENKFLAVSTPIDPNTLTPNANSGTASNQQSNTSKRPSNLSQALQNSMKDQGL